MIATKRRIETEQDRYGGFSSSNPNVSYFANPNYNNEQIEGQQSFDVDNNNYATISDYTTNYDSNLQTSEETQEIDTPSYEVEKEYNVDELNSNKPDDDYMIVKTFMPNVERQKVVTEEQKQTFKTKKIKLNARGKIFVAMYSIVACLLIAFCIYNACAIGAVKNSISLKQLEYQTITKEVNVLDNQYTNLTSEESINNSIPAGFTDISTGNTTSVNFAERPEYIQITETTNWFDKLCEFFSNLF